MSRVETRVEVTRDPVGIPRQLAILPPAPARPLPTFVPRSSEQTTQESTRASGDHPQKMRGGYYTPEVIADALAAWAIQESTRTVLEPSAGDGQLVRSAVKKLSRAGHVTAIELHEAEAEKVSSIPFQNLDVITSDFFTWYALSPRDGSFDAVIGNPPFIRYQHFDDAYREAAFQLMRDEGLRPTRLTNAWLPFVVVATRALRQGGRLALVLPAELLQVSYAAELREYLARTYAELTIVTFRNLVFDGILQETILLLGIRRDQGSAAISFLELDDASQLVTSTLTSSERSELTLDHAREKWTQFYLSANELALIRELEVSPQLARLGDLATVDVGIVTGRNEFFVLTPSEATRLGLLEYCVPLVGRSAQIPGIKLRRAEWETLVARDSKCYLLQLGPLDRDRLSPAALRYVEDGERQLFHQGYKCRIRQPRWWFVPSLWIPDAFLLRQIYDSPRIIRNAAGATSTDTIHRVRMTNGTSPDWLAAASMNSVTLAFSEIRGRSYGGGVLELEPTEAEGLPFPSPAAGDLPIDDLDAWSRRNGVESTVNEVDKLVLKPLGLSPRDLEHVRGVWRKLSGRRVQRKRR